MEANKGQAVPGSVDSKDAKVKPASAARKGAVKPGAAAGAAGTPAGSRPPSAGKSLSELFQKACKEGMPERVAQHCADELVRAKTRRDLDVAQFALQVGCQLRYGFMLSSILMMRSLLVHRWIKCGS